MLCATTCFLLVLCTDIINVIETTVFFNQIIRKIKAAVDWIRDTFTHKTTLKLKVRIRNLSFSPCRQLLKQASLSQGSLCLIVLCTIYQNTFSQIVTTWQTISLRSIFNIIKQAYLKCSVAVSFCQDWWLHSSVNQCISHPVFCPQNQQMKWLQHCSCWSL